MKNIPAPGHDAPFLDEDEEHTISEIETAIDEGKILPQTSERLKACGVNGRKFCRRPEAQPSLN